MNVLRLRKLTRKSCLNFGFDETKNLPIQDLLTLKRHMMLISIYYNLDRITFTEDILDELGIKTELRIDKPGKVSRSEFQKFKQIIYDEEFDSKDDIIKDSDGYTELDRHKMGLSAKKRGASKRFKGKSNYHERKRYSKFNMQNRNHGHK